MKTYILQKDTPVSKAGEKVKKGKSLIFNFEGYRSESGEFFETATVETNPEWFKPEKTKKEKDLKAVQDVIDWLNELKKDIKWGDIKLVNITPDMEVPVNIEGLIEGDASAQINRTYKRTGEKQITIKINLQEL